MREGFEEPPLHPVPPVVWILLLPIMAMELVLSAGGMGLAGGQDGIGWRQEALQRFALSPGMLDGMIASGRWQAGELTRFLTYPFVHQGFLHALMGAVFTLALGKFVAEIFRPWAVAAIFFGGAVLGGLFYSLIPGQEVWLYGAFPAAYGLIGAFTFILWARLGLARANRSQAFAFIGVLLGFQIVIWAIAGGSLTWLADLAGFAAGFLLSFLVVPGGPARILARMRGR